MMRRSDELLNVFIEGTIKKMIQKLTIQQIMKDMAITFYKEFQGNVFCKFVFNNPKELKN